MVRVAGSESTTEKAMIYTGNDGSKYRLQRLERASKYVTAILGMSHDQLDRLVHAMHDKKGVLMVEWMNTYPTKTQIAAFSRAWDMCGESPYSVFHSINEAMPEVL